MQKVLFSIGSGEVNDFTNIQTLLSTTTGTTTLTNNFAALAAALPLDGFDFDDEDNYNVDTVATLTGILSGNGDGDTIITYCPYTDMSFWVQCLQKVYANLSVQPVQAFNLQEYGGGGDPATWASAVQSPASGGSTGVSDGAAFVVPGFSAGTDSSKSQMTPSEIQSKFASLTKCDAGIDGGMIWNLSRINAASFTPAQYASAISNGLSGTAVAAVA